MKNRWGSNNPNSRLTPEQVEKIRKLYAKGDTSCQKLSFEFGVSSTTIHNIIMGRSWK